MMLDKGVDQRIKTRRCIFNQVSKRMQRSYSTCVAGQDEDASGLIGYSACVDSKRLTRGLLQRPRSEFLKVSRRTPRGPAGARRY